MTRTLKSDHAKATEALQAAQRRHDKASQKVLGLRKELQEAEKAYAKAQAAFHYAAAHPALAGEDTAGEVLGGGMAAT